MLLLTCAGIRQDRHIWDLDMLTSRFILMLAEGYREFQFQDQHLHMLRSREELSPHQEDRATADLLLWRRVLPSIKGIKE